MTRSLTDVPGPKPLPLVGNLAALGADPLGFFTGLARDHGPVTRFVVAGQTNLVLTEPEDIEQVLVKHRATTVKDPITSGLSALLGEGLLTAEGETWRRNRRTMAPSFQPRHIAELAQTMVESTQGALEDVEDGVLDVHEHMMTLTLDIAVRTLFGSVLEDTAQVGPLVEEVMGGFELQVHTWRRLLPGWLPTPSKRRIARTRARLHAILEGIVARKRAEGAESADLLSRLLAARDEEGRGMSDEQLRDELLTLFLAGHETTALTLSYGALLLAQHPEVQARAREELEAVTDGGPLTASHARQLPYLDAVVQEAMRLYPPAWIVGRQATEDIVVGNLAVPAGTVLLMPQWVVHRDPRWYPEPEAFRPERWLGEHDRPRFAFFPFGGGARVCIGNHFARMEAVLVLAAWLRAVELSPAAGFELEVGPSVTLRPRGGVRVEVRRRAGRQAAA